MGFLPAQSGGRPRRRPSFQPQGCGGMEWGGAAARRRKGRGIPGDRSPISTRFCLLRRQGKVQ